jgi:hypothetical protein
MSSMILNHCFHVYHNKFTIILLKTNSDQSSNSKSGYTAEVYGDATVTDCTSGFKGWDEDHRASASDVPSLVPGIDFRSGVYFILLS